MAALSVSVKLHIHKTGDTSHSSGTWTETKYAIPLCTRHSALRQSSYLTQKCTQMPAKVQISITIL